jgi:hypothetical protein
LHCTLRALQNRARLNEESAAGFGKPHCIRNPVKKRDTKLVLQIPDLPA